MGITLNGNSIASMHTSVLDPIVTQECGNSEVHVMSQKAVTEHILEVFNELGIGNLINPNDPDVEVGGYYRAGSGGAPVWQSDSIWSESGYIPIKAKEKFVIGAGTTYTTYMQFVYYDADKNVIRAKETTADGNVFTAIDDENVAFIRVPFKSTHMMFRGEVTPSQWVHNYTHLSNVVKSLMEDSTTVEVLQETGNSTEKVMSQKAVTENLVPAIVNVFNPDDEEIETGGYYQRDTWIGDTAWLTTGFIPCKAGDKFTPNVAFTGGASGKWNIQFVFYNAQKEYVTGTTGTPDNTTVLTIPNNPNIAYVRIPVRQTQRYTYAIWKIENGGEYYDKLPELQVKTAGIYANYNSKVCVVDDVIAGGTNISSLKKVLQNITNNGVAGEHWFGKTWYAYGTSLTSSAQGKYVPYVAEFSGMSVVNKGIPGGALVANKNIYNALMSTTDGKVNADLITIEVGANDASAPLGEITSMDTTTFCGALNTCLKNILTNCPKAQVVLMGSTRGRYSISDPSTPYELNYELAGGYTTLERDEAIRKVAVANGIYYIPFGSMGLGLFRMQAGNLYNVDNIHHTDLGGYNLAQGVWAYLKNIPLWYNELPS